MRAATRHSGRGWRGSCSSGGPCGRSKLCESFLSDVPWKLVCKLALSAALATCSRPLPAQDLAPRAYIITPLHSNAITLTYSFYDGSLLFDGAVPITGATGKYNVPVFSYYHSFNMFGRSANVTASLPYAIGHFQATVLGEPNRIYRSGLLDSSYRLSVNLKGGPSMELPEYHKWKQKTLIGVSLRVVAPTGQYDPTKLVNWSANRWAVRPELGYSKRWDKILLMLTAESGSTRSTPITFRAINSCMEPRARAKIRWGPSKGISATTSNPAHGYHSMATSGSAASPV